MDRPVTDIVLEAIRCPSPSTLGRAIREENDRRQAAGRLVAAEVRQAEAEVAEARAHLADYRDRDRDRCRNPEIMEMYEDEVAAAIRALHAVRQRQAALPPPTLIATTPAFLAELARAFRLLPDLWRSGRLAVEDRKAIVRLVIQRVQVQAGDNGTVSIKVFLHTGTVVERTLFGMEGRRMLMETLFAHLRDVRERERVQEDHPRLKPGGRSWPARRELGYERRAGNLEESDVHWRPGVRPEPEGPNREGYALEAGQAARELDDQSGRPPGDHSTGPVGPGPAEAPAGGRGV